MLMIDDVLVDERPASFGGIQKVRLAGKLVGVEEADDGLGLRPPMLVGVDDAGGVGFVEQAAIAVESLLVERPAPSSPRPRARAPEAGIAENLRSLAEQPASLDVVAKGYLMWSADATLRRRTR
jgi:hypothetical protein